MSNLKDYEDQIKLLITQEKWAEAYKSCNEIINIDPENITFIKLRNKIEAEVKRHNQRSIEDELNKLEPLLRSHNYTEYLKQISPLQSYSEDFPIVRHKIIAAKKLLDSEYDERKTQVYQEEIKQIDTDFEHEHYEEALQRLDQLRKSNIQTEQITKLEKKYKKKYLDIELRRNKRLLNSNKFEDIIIFLLKLRKLDPTDSKINSLIESTKESYRLFKIDNQKDYIFKTIEEVKTLYIRKEYDKVLILCARILEIDDKNSLTLSYQHKAESKIRKDSNAKIFKLINHNFKSFKNTSEYRDQNFISI